MNTLTPRRTALAAALGAATLLGSGCTTIAAGPFERTLHTEIAIDAPAEAVWSELMDFAAYPDWNPMVRRLEGDATPGATLDAFVQAEGTKGMRFRPTVQVIESERRFVWRGKLGVRGVFDGEHGFVIEPLERDRVRFVHSERFTGLLVPVLMPLIRDDTRRGFEAMNQALKARVESRLKVQWTVPTEWTHHRLGRDGSPR